MPSCFVPLPFASGTEQVSISYFYHLSPSFHRCFLFMSRSIYLSCVSFHPAGFCVWSMMRWNGGRVEWENQRMRSGIKKLSSLHFLFQKDFHSILSFLFLSSSVLSSDYVLSFYVWCPQFFSSHPVSTTCLSTLQAPSLHVLKNFFVVIYHEIRYHSPRGFISLIHITHRRNTHTYQKYLTSEQNKSKKSKAPGNKRGEWITWVGMMGREEKKKKKEREERKSKSLDQRNLVWGWNRKIPRWLVGGQQP